MENYNKFEEFLNTLKFVTPDRRRKKDRIAFMGKEGDETEPAWEGDEQKPSFKTCGYMLCYYELTKKIEWKSIYKNTKGFFIKYRKKSYYLKHSQSIT